MYIKFRSLTPLYVTTNRFIEVKYPIIQVFSIDFYNFDYILCDRNLRLFVKNKVLNLNLMLKTINLDTFIIVSK